MALHTIPWTAYLAVYKFGFLFLSCKVHQYSLIVPRCITLHAHCEHSIEPTDKYEQMDKPYLDKGT